MTSKTIYHLEQKYLKKAEASLNEITDNLTTEELKEIAYNTTHSNDIDKLNICLWNMYEYTQLKKKRKKKK